MAAPINKNTSAQDPTQSLAQIKNEIEFFVTEHNQTVEGYEDQISVLKSKISDEKKLLSSKKEEFRKMLKEIQDLTSDFSNDSEPKNKPNYHNKPKAKNNNNPNQQKNNSPSQNKKVA